MANQDPQPEIYRVNAAFAAAAAAGTTSVTNITTSQANNEEVRVYTLPSPILVLYQYPLSITTTCVNALTAGATNGRTLIINLISELALQKVAGTYTDSDFPRSR